ncbi:hypothetical protein LDENG_00150490 [Lucifuga dentata]|nr:hypothetical protein LDENG_00150490 [Lucifuga dentata]
MTFKALHNLVPPYLSDFSILHPVPFSAILLCCSTVCSSLQTQHPGLSAALYPDSGTLFHYTSISWTPSHTSNHRLKHTCLNWLIHYNYINHGILSILYLSILYTFLILT